MSNTAEWSKRLATHRYSQDERSLSYKFVQELQPTVESFLNSSNKTLSVGVFNIQQEPWRVLAVLEFRKYGLKMVEKYISDNEIELILRKQKLSSVLSGK